MGSMNIFDIESIKRNFNLSYFIETGTGIGNSLKYVLEKTNENKFDEYFSIEISTSLYEQCLLLKQNYKNQNITLINSNSSDGLKEILLNIPQNKNVFFWLDAHFPDADHNNASYNSTTDKHIRIPLEEEIKIIKENRKNCKDYFIIDDLRIYEDGNFEGGNWRDRSQCGGNGIQFIHDAFSDTHNITKLFNHEGYIIVIPKDIT